MRTHKGFEYVPSGKMLNIQQQKKMTEKNAIQHIFDFRRIAFWGGKY